MRKGVSDPVNFSSCEKIRTSADSKERNVQRTYPFRRKVVVRRGSEVARVWYYDVRVNCVHRIVRLECDGRRNTRTYYQYCY